MTRVLAALLCCAALLAAVRCDNEDVLDAVVESTEGAAGDGLDTAEEGNEPPPDDDGDSAPFTNTHLVLTNNNNDSVEFYTSDCPFRKMVEHADGRRCSASLVSLRTAVTSARCARPAPAPSPDLWVHAPPAAAPHASRRVARIAYAAESEIAEEGPEWSDADVAVLELEAPLGGGARAILMATGGAECGPPGACHVVRARARPRSRRSWLRIVDEALVPPAACAALAPRHADGRALLCLRGDTLCPSDWGAGVVCEGKLCGVVSRSAWEEEERRGEECGGLHAAAAVARWRRFLHCAHTPRACSRGGECAHLCTERSLLDNEVQSSGDSPAQPAPAAPAVPLAAPATAAPEPGADASDYSDTTAADRSTVPHRTSGVTENLERVSSCTRSEVAPERARASTKPRRPAPTRTAPRPRAPPAPPAPAPPASPSPRPGAEFEPNRPDFKAGEYGDNAAEYGGEESAPATRSPPPAHAAPPARPSPAPAGLGAGGAPVGPDAPRRELSARVSEDAAPARATAPSASLVLLFFYFSI